MPPPFTSSNSLKSRLLAGASAAVIVLALSVAAPGGAVAQAVTAVDGITYNSSDDSTPVGGVTEAQSIDRGFSEAATGDATITIDLSDTNDTSAGFTNDSSGGASQALTINIIDNLTTNDGNTLTVGTIAASNGGTIAINVGQAGIATDDITLVVEGDVTEATGGQVSIVLGDAAAIAIAGIVFDADGGAQTVDAAISDAADDNDLVTLRVANSNTTMAGTTTFTDSVVLGTDDTITVGGAGETTAVFQDTVTADGGITVDATNAAATLTLGGGASTPTVTGDIDSASAANAATLTIAGAATVTLAGNINSTAAWAGVSIGDGATFTIAGNVADEAPITIGDSSTLEIDGTGGDRTVNSAVTASAATSTLITSGGNSVTFNEAVGTDAQAIDTLTLGVDTLFNANAFGGATAITGTTTFAGTTAALRNTSGAGAVVVGNGTDAATLTIAGNAAHAAGTTINNLGTLIFDAAGAVMVAGTINGTADANTTLRTTSAGPVTFNAEVGTTQLISLIDIDAATTFNQNVTGNTFDIDGTTFFLGDVIAQTFDVGTGAAATMNGSNYVVAGDITGEGTLELGPTAGLQLGANGETSTVSIASLDGSSAGNGAITFANGSMVTIETAIGAGGAIRSFTLNDADTVVTINATETTAITGHTTVAQTLDLGAGTIILGSNIGNGDTVFSFTGDTGLATTAGETTTVQVAANFTIGQIILADTGVDQTNAHDGLVGDGEITVINNALTTYTLGDGADNTEIAITAAATTNSQAAATLGVSTEQADALRQATQSGDTAFVDLLTTALNAGGTQATQAARQVGPQGETLGGSAQTAFEVSGQQRGVTSNRLAGQRGATGSRFASAFAATQSGISGGDLSGPYAPQAPRYAGSLWFQGFGGIANADGDTAIAGYDANFGGAMIGIDGALTDNVTIGAFGSYTHSTVDGDGAGNAQMDADTYSIGVYGSYTGARFYLDGFASFAGSNNDVSRTAVGQTITGSYDAIQFALSLAGGAPIEVSSNVFVTPNASLTWNSYDADGYTETGVGATTVSGQTANTLTGTIGARIHAVYENFDNDGTVFIPELRVGIIGDLVDDDAVTTATFVGGGTAFNVTGTNTDDIGALIGVGLGLDNPGWSAGISYDADLRSDYMSHTARAEFRWKF